jgi:hypothetical protein
MARCSLLDLGHQLGPAGDLAGLKSQPGDCIGCPGGGASTIPGEGNLRALGDLVEHMQGALAVAEPDSS